MGEAKRRKGFDPNFGKTVNECFIANSFRSDNHTVYIKIGRQKPNIYPLSFFNNIEKAMMMKAYCNYVFGGYIPKLKDFLGIARELQSVLKNQLGEFTDDRRVDKVLVNEKKNRIKHLETLKPAVKKRYKPASFSVDQNVTSKAWGVMEFDPYDDPIQGVLIDKDLYIFNYESAAYIADYMNSNNLDSIDSEQGNKLRAEIDLIRERISMMSETELKEAIAKFTQPQPV